jgi:hypothetical protein
VTLAYEDRSQTALGESGQQGLAGPPALLTDSGAEAVPVSASRATAVWSVDFSRWPRTWRNKPPPVTPTRRPFRSGGAVIQPSCCANTGQRGNRRRHAEARAVQS